MSAFPIRAKGGQAFTPECLEHIEGAPSFHLRTATFEDKVEITGEFARLRLQVHGDEAFRGAYIAGLKSLYSEESADHGQARLRAYWDAIDSMQAKVNELIKRRADAAGDEEAVAKINSEIDNLKVEFDEDEGNDLDRLIDEISRNYAPLGEMAKDNIRYQAFSGRVILSVVCTGWTGIDVPFRKSGAYLDMEALSAAIDALGEFEEANKMPVGIASMQLQTAALRQLRITKEEEKNSPTLPSQPSNPDSLSGSETMTAPTSPVSDASKTSA